MNRKYLIILIVFLLMIFSVSCKKDEEGKTKEEPNLFDVEIDNLEIEEDGEKDLEFKSEDLDKLSFTIDDNEIVSFEAEDKTIHFKALKIGSTKLVVKASDEIIKEINIKVIEKVIFIPVATGKLLLKGIDKEASVKVIITKDGLNLDDIKWTIDSDCIQMETQGAIAHFKSLSRGKAVVTIALGEYTNSFVIYVTNIRGDIE